ncbi:hypothetical protein ACTFIV_009990 [Dictyostelium citrinum]
MEKRGTIRYWKGFASNYYCIPESCLPNIISFDQWGVFRVKFYQNHPKINELPDCIRNENDEPLKLKEIYELMIKDRYPTPKRTELQKLWAVRYNTAILKVFININTISHQKGRNTLFRFFSRSLPGINHDRDTRCKICGHLFRDPYSHLFTLCQDVLDIEKTIISTVNKLSFIKIHRCNFKIKNTNQDLHKYKFNKAWQTPAAPNPLPI